MTQAELLKRLAALLLEYEEGNEVIVGCYFEGADRRIHEFNGKFFETWSRGDRVERQSPEDNQYREGTYH